MKTALIFLLFSFSLKVIAQVPNWTKTSCEGVEYSMHQELASGNAVVLDFTAMWCNPCNIIAPELEQVWQNYGAGTMNVKVFGMYVQDIQSTDTDCAEVTSYKETLNLTFPGFSDCEADYTTFADLYTNGEYFFPMILVFVPDVNNPGNSQIIFNWFNDSNDIGNDLSDYIMSLLIDEGFFALSTEDINSLKLEVQPNPTSDELNVIIDNKLLNHEYRIYDETGRILKNGKFQELNTIIDIQDFDNGIYFLKTQESNQSLKFVKY